MKYMVLVAACVLLLNGASFGQSTKSGISPARVAARKEFGALGLQYSRESFLKQASEGDAIGVKAFLDAGMNPDVTDKDGNTALILSTEGGFLETARVLISGGANLEETGRYGHTPLIIAASKNHPAIVRLLLESGAEVNVPGRYSALIAGATYPAVVELLLSHGADVDTDDGRAVVFAANRLPKATFESLLKKANVTQTLLDDALVQAAFNSDPGVAQVLLERGANVNAHGNRGVPLVNAAANHNPAVAELLLANGAKVDVQDKDDYTPILNATRVGNVELVQKLLERGADLSLSVNQKIVSVAVDKGNLSILRLLLDHHAHVGAKTAYTSSPLEQAMQQGKTALFAAILQSGLDAVQDRPQILFEAVADNRIDLVEALLDNGVDVDSAQANGYTVLMRAARGGDYNIVKLLLSRGADVNAKTNNDVTALSEADSTKQSEIARLLLSSGATK